MPRMTEKEKEEYRRLVADKKELKRKIREVQSAINRRTNQLSEIKKDIASSKRIYQYYELGR